MKKQKPTILATITRDLPVALTPGEIIERSRELATALQERAVHGDHEAEVKAGLKLKAAEIEARVQRLAIIVRTGKESQPVTCEQLADYPAGTVTLVRTDTGEVVESRRMGDTERQAQLIDESDELDD